MKLALSTQKVLAFVICPFVSMFVEVAGNDRDNTNPESRYYQHDEIISHHRTRCNEHSKEEIACFSLPVNLGPGAKRARREEADVEATVLSLL